MIEVYLGKTDEQCMKGAYEAGYCAFDRVDIDDLDSHKLLSQSAAQPSGSGGNLKTTSNLNAQKNAISDSRGPPPKKKTCGLASRLVLMPR
jgi:hypothetical protein